MSSDAVSPHPAPAKVTELLRECRGGSHEALNRLLPVVYGELRALARRHLSHERRVHTLQATALVHEAYLKLVDQRNAQWQNRAHFFSLAARIMRRILVDHARRRKRAKRGSTATHVTLLEGLAACEPREIDTLALEDALTELERLDPQQSRIVELRFFGGLTIDEIADVLGVSAGTVKREWRTARIWLSRQLQMASA
jgi:RNA polymerase sigma factor (TIGR02999 family)